MAEASESELNKLFAAGGKELAPDVLAELRSIMRLHNLSSEDTFYKWESYCIKMELEASQMSLEMIRAFKQDIQDALEKSTRQQAHVKTEKRPTGTPRSVVKTGDVFGMWVYRRADLGRIADVDRLDGLVPSTPATGRLKAGNLRKKALETPVSRLKGDIPSSSPDHKTPTRMEEQLRALGGST
jgi:DNA polymerase alpha subunit B